MLQERTAQIVGGLCLAVTASLVNLWAADDRSLEDLRWIAGHWVAADELSTSEEIWTDPGGGLMMGLSRAVSAENPAFFEYLRIEERGDEIVYVASPMGTATTEFLLVSCEGMRVVFENSAHDYPQRIVYVRDGDVLTATISGVDDGVQKSSVFVWRLKE